MHSCTHARTLVERQKPLPVRSHHAASHHTNITSHQHHITSHQHQHHITYHTKPHYREFVAAAAKWPWPPSRCRTSPLYSKESSGRVHPQTQHMHLHVTALSIIIYIYLHTSTLFCDQSKTTVFLITFRSLLNWSLCTIVPWIWAKIIYFRGTGGYYTKGHWS